jgi:hypothetical protein
MPRSSRTGVHPHFGDNGQRRHRGRARGCGFPCGVASFGTAIPPDAVIDESLERATDPSLRPVNLGQQLVQAIDADLQASLNDNALRTHPLAIWIEMEIGLGDGQRLTRRGPITLVTAAKRLTAQTGRPEARCETQLKAMLMLMSRRAV